MPEIAPDQEWWTASEIAEARLPDLPLTKRHVNRLVAQSGWQGDPKLARRRKGRGGGWEYHWSLMPQRARAALLAAAVSVEAESGVMDREEAWAQYEGLKAPAKARAASRLAAIQAVEALVDSGLTKDLAVQDIAQQQGVSPRTIWNWFEAVDAVREDDRLAYLAPRNGSGRAASRAVPVDPDFAALIRADYLRPAGPALAAVHRRQARVARKEGIPVAPYHTVRRWVARTISPPTMVLARKGVDALKRMYPPQVRDKSSMHAMEAVNGDFHRFDVFVKWPGEDKPVRPQMVAFQDIYSGRIVSWRVDRSANSHAVQLCIGDMIEDWGIPEHVLLDNGREFAAKLITGGSKTRFRFKIKEDDVPGLLTSLGCEIHWATPYAGQSKPIERAFRDLCEDVAKDPRFEGAYTGNGIDAQPENYGSRAIPLEDFLQVLAEGIEDHNTRSGRRSEVAYGRSFAEVFDESYANAPIKKATAAQRRLWLMGAEGLNVDKLTGVIRLHKNDYFADFLHGYRGQKVVARFDGADLWSGIHIYTLQDEYLGHAECQVKAGFFDLDEARAHSRARGEWIKSERAALKALKTLDAAELGRKLDAAAPPPETPASVEAKVVRMAIPAARQQVQAAPRSAEQMSEQAEVIADISARREARAASPETAREIYIRAREIEQRIEAGEDVTRDQCRWLAGYQRTPEYETWAEMVREFGEGSLAK